MINVIPDWLQDAINFLNRKFPEDEDVNVSMLYGFDSVSTGENNCGFSVYNTETKTIFLADYNEFQRSSKDLYLADIKYITITNLFHEYRHHQQSIYGWDFSEEDAEIFAIRMYTEFISRTYQNIAF